MADRSDSSGRSKALPTHAAKLRQLTDSEISRLKDNGNIAVPSSWESVLVPEEFCESSCDFIFRSTFRGACQLGTFQRLSRGSSECPVGVYNSNLTGCVLHNNVRISDCVLIKNVEVEEDCTVAGCGSVVCEGKNCGEGTRALIGNEIGKRELQLSSQLPFDEAVKWVMGVESRDRPTKSRPMIIRKGSSLVNCPQIKDVYVSSGTYIRDSTLRNCTILSDDSDFVYIESGVVVENSIIHKHNTIKNMAIIENCLIYEGCHITNHSKVSDSVVGSFTALSCGEVHNSFLGPLIAAHHQSLVQSVIAPYGRANIAYGSNVGSNHTGRAPDQEMWLGEGVFIGLGVNVKYPLSLLKSPYSIVAAGVTLLPQNVGFPFCLINSLATQMEGVPSVYNEIFPGWVLLNSPYTVLRNIRKYKLRSTGGTAKVFNDRVVFEMINAMKMLQSTEGKKFYTDADIPLLGKNSMTENSRLEGIRAYKRYITYSVLESLFESFQSLSSNPDYCVESLEELPKCLGQEEISENLCFPPSELPQRYLELKESLLSEAAASKNKDNIRGRNIIPNYDAFYDEISHDSVIKAERKELDAFKQSLQSVPAARLVIC